MSFANLLPKNVESSKSLAMKDCDTDMLRTEITALTYSKPSFIINSFSKLVCLQNISYFFETINSKWHPSKSRISLSDQFLRQSARAKTVQERTRLCEKHVFFKLPPFSPHLHGRGKRKAILKLIDCKST